jgi:hypothetical protein
VTSREDKTEKQTNCGPSFMETNTALSVGKYCDKSLHWLERWREEESSDFTDLKALNHFASMLTWVADKSKMGLT